MTPSARNVALYPWFKFFQNLIFWQAIWFLYFQSELSAAEAILLYAIYDVGTTALEVPSGYMSDRIGRRFTLIASAVAGCAGTALLALGDSFALFALGQLLLGAGMAFASGTDTAMLYESLAAQGRETEIEHQEVKAWRHSFVGLAVSAVTGGSMALFSMTLPFVAGAIAFGFVILLTLRFSEPPKSDAAIPQGGEVVRFVSLRRALTRPVLIWLFALSVLMYGFSHLPFIFGQPYILEALRDIGLERETPLVSGTVSALMMILSVAVSLVAPTLRHALGLPTLLLIAFALQIAIIAILALTSTVLAIAVLFLRMVPDSLSRAFILARIQPLLSDDSRATYLSLQSLCGRLLFAASLWFASGGASAAGEMAHGDIRRILLWYTAAGVIGLVTLAFAARRIPVEGKGNTASGKESTSA